MKKVLLLFAYALTTVWAMLMLPMVAMAQSFTEGGLKYEIIPSTTTVKVVKPTEGKYSGAITIPATVTHDETTYKVVAIGDNAFQAATGVTSVTLPLTSIESIGAYAFNDCTGLTEITLPESITSIGEKAFYYCDNLKHLYVHSPNPESYNAGSLAFSKIHYGSHVCTLHVPTGKTAVYAADDVFGVFTQVEEFDAPKITCYDLYVAGTQVNSLNASDILGDGAARYDAEKKILTIKGDITSNDMNYSCISNAGVSDLTINVTKPATLTSLGETIIIKKDTKITGSSLLKLVSPKDNYAIRSYYANLAIVNANLEVKGPINEFGYSAVLTINNSSVTVKNSSNICAIRGWIDLVLKDCYIKTPVGAMYATSSALLIDSDFNDVQSVEIRPGVGPIYYGLYIAGKQVTSENASDILGDGAASYDAENKILTIKGDITSNDMNYSCITNSGVSDLTINVAKPAMLTSSVGSIIFLWEDTKITGSPLLKLSFPLGAQAIFSMKGDLTIVDANLKIEGSIEGNELTIINSSVTVKTTSDMGAIRMNSSLVLTDCYIKTPAGGTFNSSKHRLEDADGNAAKTVEIVPKVGPTLYDLYIAGERVTSDNASNILGDGAASYDAEKKILTIKGVIIAPDENTYCIKNQIKDLTIQVAAPAELTAKSNAIYVDANTTITGSSLLVLSGSEASLVAEQADLTISNANLSIEGTIYHGNTGNIVIDNSTIKCGVIAFNDFSNDLTITNSTVSVECEIITYNPGTLTISNSTVTVTKPKHYPISGWTSLTLKDCYFKTPLGGYYSTVVYDGKGKALTSLLEIVPTKALNGLAISETTATVKMDEDFTLPTLTNPNSLSVTWESSDEKVATVNASTGAVTLVAPGQTTISASFAGDDKYQAGSVSYILTVKSGNGDVNHDGKVDADDIKAVVDYILTGKTDGFYFDNANLNGDKKVDVADLVLLINKVK